MNRFDKTQAVEICSECHSTIQAGYRGACVTCLRKEIERLQAIVDRLPRTANGVEYFPGMPLYQARVKPCCGTVAITRYEGGHTVEVDGKARRFGHNNGWLVIVGECYSTQDAADAAERGGSDD